MSLLAEPVKVFWLEETDLVKVSLRRFDSSAKPNCSGGSYCNASRIIVPIASKAKWHEIDPGFSSPGRSYYRTKSENIKPDDPRFPKKCHSCGRPIINGTNQVNADELYKGAPNGRLHTLRDAPPGAMWDAWWMGEWFRGLDGIVLMVRLPNGWDWMVDGEASNCTKPAREQREDGRTYLTKRTHYCWVRHGDPTKGDVHVDKDGNTCAAGAGSIQGGNWHGFLHHGYLHQ